MTSKDNKIKKDAKSQIRKEDTGSRSGDKARRKWPQRKVPAKLYPPVLFDKAAPDNSSRTFPNWKVITPGMVSGRLKPFRSP